MTKSNVYLLDKSVVSDRMRERGFQSLGEFAAYLGVHRNSVSRYFSEASVLPEVVSRVIDTLDLPVGAVLRRRQDTPTRDVASVIAPVVQRIVERYPSLSVLLFGSRARGSGRKYSDIDLGILGAEKLKLSQWAELKELVENHTADLPFTFDVVDLGRADRDFLRAVTRDMIFLGGNPVPFTALQETA
jgi:predicted nucleotidyltransferase